VPQARLRIPDPEIPSMNSIPRTVVLPRPHGIALAVAALISTSAVWAQSPAAPAE
jgi:hypothetical protein